MDIHEIAAQKFPRLGVNKRREVARLLFEISKRDNRSPGLILEGFEYKNYAHLKGLLLSLRYPQNYSSRDLKQFYLPKLEIKSHAKADLSRPLFRPKHIYVENSVKESFLADRLKSLFPEAKVAEIPTLKEFPKGKSFSILDYNRRTETIFIIKQVGDFFKTCPCTKGAVHCGYNVMNLGFGCPFECAYCYLQEYQNIPGIVLPADLEEFFKQFDSRQMRKGSLKMARVGTGEFTDSLALDPITGYSKAIIEFFGAYPDIFFEFKTKSTNIENILASSPGPNIVVSWSVNPQTVINESEALTASLSDRIMAAKKCVQAGFKVGFHFDPLIYYDRWESDYEDVAAKIFENIPEEKIAWISLGTLRFAPPLKKVIENRFPQNKFLDEELILDFDGKLRYSKILRDNLISVIAGFIRKKLKRVLIYPCMEEIGVWTLSGPCSGKPFP